jgi:hypothetical protein
MCARTVVVRVNLKSGPVDGVEPDRKPCHDVDMVQTWKTGDGDDFTCPHCGAVYQVKIHRAPIRDSDFATCEVCKKRMNEWNSTSYPEYTLKKPKKDA